MTEDLGQMKKKDQLLLSTILVINSSRYVCHRRKKM